MYNNTRICVVLQAMGLAHKTKVCVHFLYCIYNYIYIRTQVVKYLHYVHMYSYACIRSYVHTF